jgi:hypothetical protein
LIAVFELDRRKVGRLSGQKKCDWIHPIVYETFTTNRIHTSEL